MFLPSTDLKLLPSIPDAVITPWRVAIPCYTPVPVPLKVPGFPSMAFIRVRIAFLKPSRRDGWGLIATAELVNRSLKPSYPLHERPVPYSCVTTRSPILTIPNLPMPNRNSVWSTAWWLTTCVIASLVRALSSSWRRPERDCLSSALHPPTADFHESHLSPSALLHMQDDFPHGAYLAALAQLAGDTFYMRPCRVRRAKVE